MAELKFLENLTEYFTKLPGVGKKTASRYSFAIIEKLSIEEVQKFAEALVETKTLVKYCQKCGMLTTQELCEICNNPLRDQKQIMIVKDSKDVIAIEKTNQFNGLYHILGGLISPLDGIGPDDLNIDALEQRIREQELEVIIATSFTPQGETTAVYLEKILANPRLVISRIGFGIPAGGDLEYVDELTLRRAIDSRK